MRGAPLGTGVQVSALFSGKGSCGSFLELHNLFLACFGEEPAFQGHWFPAPLM